MFIFEITPTVEKLIAKRDGAAIMMRGLIYSLLSFLPFQFITLGNDSGHYLIGYIVTVGLCIHWRLHHLGLRKVNHIPKPSLMKLRKDKIKWGIFVVNSTYLLLWLAPEYGWFAWALLVLITIVYGKLSIRIYNELRENHTNNLNRGNQDIFEA